MAVSSPLRSAERLRKRHVFLTFGPQAGPHRTRLFREVPISDLPVEYLQVSPLRGRKVCVMLGIIIICMAENGQTSVLFLVYVVYLSKQKEQNTFTYRTLQKKELSIICTALSQIPENLPPKQGLCNS